MSELPERVRPAADLVAALGALPEIPKGGVARVPGRPDRRYMRLDDILTAVRPVLLANHLALMQDVETRERGVSVTTRIVHTSGDVFESAALVLACQQDPQSVGSAITYAKRYSLAAFLGIAADDDDDGQTAQVHTPPRNSKETPPTPPPAMRPPPDPVEPGEMGDLGSPTHTNPAQEGHRRKLWAMLSSAGMREDQQRREWVGAFLAIEPGWHWDQLTSAQVSAAIERLKTEPVDVGPDRPRR